MKVLLDFSGWIEFFTDGPKANRYAAYLTPRHHLITPTIVLYEVYKKIKRERGEETAVQFAERLHAIQIIPLTESIALLAADLSIQHGLAMADAMVYATGLDQEAHVVTGDADLEGLPSVVYIK